MKFNHLKSLKVSTIALIIIDFQIFYLTPLITHSFSAKPIIFLFNFSFLIPQLLLDEIKFFIKLNKCL